MGHLPGADKEHPLVVESLEDPAGKVGHGDTGDREPLAADRGFSGNALRRPQGRLEHAAGEGAGGLLFLGEGPGLLHLGDDLRLSEHHAVEPGGDAEEMVDGGLVVLAGEHRREQRRIDPTALGEEIDELPRGRRRTVVFAGSIELDAVTGGEEHPFAARETLAKAAQGLGRLFGGEGEPLPQFHGHRAVGSTHEGERHRITPGRGGAAVGKPAASITAAAAGDRGGPA